MTVKFVKSLPVIATICLIVSVLLLFLFPENRQVDHGKIVSITSYSFAGIIFWIAIFVAIASLAISIYSLATKNRWGFLPLAVLFICPITVMPIIITNAMAGMYEQARLNDIDGQEYHLLSADFLQGRMMVIARVLGKSGATTKYEFIARTGFDSPREYQTVVRPQGTSESQLFFITPNRFLVAVIGETEAFCAYDLANGVSYGKYNQDEAEPIGDMSPFVLLGERDTPLEADVKFILDHTGFGANTTGITLGLQHPNPKARQLAQRLLDNVAKATSKPPEQ